MKAGLFIVALFSLDSAPLCGQVIGDSLGGSMDDVFEKALDDGTRDMEDSQFAESLFQLSVDRIDVNSATASDLLQVPGLDPLLVSRILTYRDGHTFQRLEELLLVEGIDRRLFLEIRGFLRAGNDQAERKSPAKAILHFTSRTSRDLQVRRGYQDGSYVGGPTKLYNKLKGRWSIGTKFFAEAAGLTEKDAGERNAADFATGYLSVGTTSGTFRCVVGNYVVEAGQGLIFWKSSGSTKGSEVIATVTRNPRGLEPNSSSDENGFLQGVAVQTKLGAYEITALYSQKRINASLNEKGYITSVDDAGLFRTTAELKKRGSSTEQLVGLNANAWVVDGLRVGIRGYRSRFGNPVAYLAADSIPHNIVSVTGIDFSYVSTNVGSFAEAAVDQKGSVAAVGGVVFEPVQGFAATLVVRSYPYSFFGLHGYGFGESGNQLRNERGFYASTRLTPLAWLSLSGYYDQFVFPGPTSVSPFPTSGNESILLAQIRPNDEVSLQFQMRQKSQSDEQAVRDEFLRQNSVVGRNRQINYRATFEWWPISSLRWKTRFEHVSLDYSVGASGSSGFLFFQDFHLKPLTRFNVDGRVIVFETDSYFSRIYEYESELRGTFANAALYGKGIRLYILARYEFSGVEISAKYSTTIKPGLRFLGSGPSEISGDTDNHISAQIDLTL